MSLTQSQFMAQQNADPQAQLTPEQQQRLWNYRVSRGDTAPPQFQTAPGGPAYGSVGGAGSQQDYDTRNAVGTAHAATARVNDPSRWSPFNQQQQSQGALGDYFAGLATGRSGQSAAALQQQQGQDAALRAMQATALSNQGANAPGLSQRNLLDATGQAQAQMVQQGQLARIQEQNAAAGTAAGIYGNLAGQSLNRQNIQGGQDVAASGQEAGANIQRGALGQQAQMANAQNWLQNQGQQNQYGLGKQQLDQQQNQWQAGYDLQTSPWNQYGVPLLNAAANVLPVFLGGG